MDSQFPSRLVKEAGPYRIIQFIQYLYQELSTRELSKKTDRSVALQGLEQRIVRAMSFWSHHGILKKYLHRMLLWQSSEGTGLQPIAYGGKKVPPWSWQALYGKIEFAVPAIDSMEWIRKITWDEDGDILLAEIASFRERHGGASQLAM
jgi:hypothetical protein